MTDLNYITNGFYVTLFANTADGEYIWNELAKEFNGVAKFPVSMKPSIFKQIKDAGYTIRKAKKVTQKNINDVLSELGDL